MKHKKPKKKGSGQKAVVYGKGKEYSEVSREVEQTFLNWLAFDGISVEGFDRRMQMRPHRVEERVNEAGDVEINVYAGFSKVITPLVFPASAGASVEALDDFLVDAIFLLYHVASRYEDKSFEKAVEAFGKRMLEERKMTLG